MNEVKKRYNRCTVSQEIFDENYRIQFEKVKADWIAWHIYPDPYTDDRVAETALLLFKKRICLDEGITVPKPQVTSSKTRRKK